MSDNELDNLFKEAADGFKAPNDPSAWQGMANKLDQAAVTTSFWNWKIISSLSVLGVTSIALILYVSVRGPSADKIAASHITLSQTQVIENKSTDSKPAIAENKSTIHVNKTNSTSRSLNDKNDLNAGASGDKAGHALNSKSNNEQSKSLEEGKLGASRQRAASSNQALLAHNQSNVNTNKANGESEISRSAEKTGQPVLVAGVAIKESSLDSESSGVPEVSEKNSNQPESITKVAAGVAVTESVDSKNSSGSVLSEKNSNQNEADAKVTYVQLDKFPSSPDSLERLNEQKKALAEKEVSESVEGEQQAKRSEPINRFAIKLALAPDYTTVKSATPNSLGINYGLLFEYRLSNHWSVATGGIWSKKIYSAYDVEYNGYSADWVDGDCRMWDIPVNVYYNFSSRKAFSFYASAGLSSYLMKEENYVYYIETPRGTYDYPKQIKGENNEWFKTLNISMGMQFRMSQQLSLQFEPTLKAPLAGVGEGEVSLVSLGAFFNLRYEIPLHKSGRNND